MKIKEITYARSVTKDLGNFNSVKINFSATAEIDEKDENAEETLKNYVDSFLNTEIAKYSESVTKNETLNKYSKKQQTRVKSLKNAQNNANNIYNNSPEPVSNRCIIKNKKVILLDDEEC